MRKVLWYLSFRSIIRLLKKLTRIPYYLPLLVPREDTAPNFVSKLLNVDISEVKKVPA